MRLDQPGDSAVLVRLTDSGSLKEPCQPRFARPAVARHSNEQIENQQSRSAAAGIGAASHE
jgi:hypothetical protein